MYFENRGIGIAAPQVGVLRRVFIVDVGDEHGLIEFINPEITRREGTQTYMEGCLSVPGKNAEVERPAEITIKALDRNGNDLLSQDLPYGASILKMNQYLFGII